MTAPSSLPTRARPPSSPVRRPGWHGGAAAWATDHRLSGGAWRDMLHWGYRNVPEWFLPAAILPPSVMSYLLLPNTRRHIAGNLAQVIGTAPSLTEQRRVLRVFRNFGDALATAYLLYAGIRNRIERPIFQNEQNFEAGLDDERGLIVGTAHLGSWHTGAYVLRRWGRPVNVVMAPEPDPRVQMMLDGMQRVGINIIYTTGSVFSSLPALSALKRGEIVAMQLDRLHGSGSIQVQFFGRHASFPTGPLVLARATGAAILPTFIVRLDDGAHLIATEPQLRVPSTRDRAGDVRTAATSLARTLETWVRRYPLQWFNFYPYWDDPA